MSTQTPAPTVDVSAVAAKLGLTVPSGRDIYDALMGKIEPELVSVNIPTLDRKYASETAKQKNARMARYKAAYEAYDKAFADWSTELKQLVDRARREVLKEAEAKDHTHKQQLLSQLDAAMLSL